MEMDNNLYRIKIYILNLFRYTDENFTTYILTEIHEFTESLRTHYTLTLEDIKEEFSSLLNSINSLEYALTKLNLLVTSNTYVLNTKSLLDTYYYTVEVGQTFKHTLTQPSTNYVTENVSTTTNTGKLSEFSNSIRFTRFINPLISYDYKCGHYLGI